MKRFITAVGCALGIGLMPANAAASNIVLVYDDVAFPPTVSPNFVGAIVDGVPSGDLVALGYLNNLITVPAGTSTDAFADDETYDRTYSTLAPLPAATSFLDKQDSGTNVWALPGLINGSVYILAKYDQTHAGTLVWLVNFSAGDTITVPQTFSGRDVSHISAYGTSGTSVPDGGATLMLLGGALIGLGALRRKFSA